MVVSPENALLRTTKKHIFVLSLSVICSMSVTAARSRVLSFANAPVRAAQRFFIPNPQGKLNLLVYLEPLHWKSWIAILIFNIIIPPFLHMVIKYLELSLPSKLTLCLMTITFSYRTKEDNAYEFRFLKTYVFIFSNMPFSRGWSTEPSSVRGKVGFLSVLVGSSLVFWHWEAMLISYLTSRTTTLPFKNIDQLISDTTTNIVVMPGSAQLDEFKYSSESSVWKTAWSERIKPNLDKYPKSSDEAGQFIMNQPDYTAYLTFESGM